MKAEFQTKIHVNATFIPLKQDFGYLSCNDTFCETHL